MRKFLILVVVTIPMFVNGQENWLTDKDGCKVFNPFPRKNEAIEWTGECKDSIANGYGQLFWILNGKKTNNVYTGFMENGRPEGKGKYEIDSKFVMETFEGVFQNGELSFGTIFTYSKHDTIKYVGEIVNWKANGQGIMSFSNGDWFKGNFKDDYFVDGVYTFSIQNYKIESSKWKYYSTNEGTITWRDGTVFIGELKSYFPHGKGMVVYPNGRIEKGKWRNGILIRTIKNGM
ncbi:MAG: hypothetical protein N4A74_17835 [Carboxylicivirga sp.]|nr:hypothetical protein [Carboxylicivirga sp.]